MRRSPPLSWLPIVRARARAVRRTLALVAALGLAAAPAAAEEPTAPPAAGLDRLLKLPDTLDYGVERRGGATRSEWRARFAEGEARREQAEAALQKAQDELAELGGESEAWTLGPAGMGATSSDAPLSFQLRQEIKRQDAEVVRSKARLSDLQVEANLAGVPADWRSPSTESQLADDSVSSPGVKP